MFLKNIKFEDVSGKLFFKTKIIIQVNDQEEFYRKFSIPKDNRKKLDKIFIEFEKDIDENIYYISNINFDNKNEKNNNEVSENPKKYKFLNIQQLRKIIQNKFDNNN